MSDLELRGPGSGDVILALEAEAGVEGSVAYVWAIDGIEYLFATQEMPDAWAVSQGFTSVYPGLQYPGGLTCGLDIRTGDLDMTSASFEVHDVDGTMPAKFGGNLDDAEPLLFTLQPGDTAGAAQYGKHVGTEKIGTTGQRLRHSCVPGFNVGMLHYGQNHAHSLGLAATPVSDTPLLWPGRRCAVYRVENIGGSWDSLHHDNRVWFGTMLGQGEHEGGIWTFRCAGPDSWAMGTLGAGVWPEPLRVAPEFTLDETLNEHVVQASLIICKINDQGNIHHEYVSPDTPNEYTAELAGATNYADLTDGMNDILADMIADASSGSSFDSDGTIIYNVFKGSDGIEVYWETSVDGSGLYCVRLGFYAHEKVWFGLGYDPRQQVRPTAENPGRDAVANYDQYGDFHRDEEDPPGWFTGYFWSAGPKLMKWVDDGQAGLVPGDQDNNGVFPRRWPPLFAGGAVAFDFTPGQEFTVDTVEPLFLISTKSRPPPSAAGDSTSPLTISNGVGEVNAQGHLVFTGPYRRNTDNDKAEGPEGFAFELERERREGKSTQVARVGWREASDGRVETDVDGKPRLVIYEWVQPRLYGFDYNLLNGMWAAWLSAPAGATALTCRPLLAAERSNAGDLLHYTLMRLLATTGTAGEWYSDPELSDPVYGLSPPAAYLDRGQNDMSAALPIDAETAELGLRIPASMIQDESDWLSAVAGIGPNLRRAKIGLAAATSARETIRAALAPSGLCMSLAGGKFGIVDVWRFPTPNDAAGTVTSEDYAGQIGNPAGSIPKQKFRIYSPIDKIKVNARIEPYAKTYARTLERRSTDMGSRYRAQTIEHQINADHLVDHRLLATAGANWSADFGARWATGFNFWGKQHFSVDLVLHAIDAMHIWPGDGITLTDQWVANPDGTYGVSLASGWVIRRTFEPGEETVHLQTVINSETDFRMYGPAGVVTRYDEDDEGEGYRLLVVDDYFGMRTHDFDVTGFGEQAWSNIGGNAKIEVWSYDGVTWRRGIYGTTSSVTEAEGGCWINLTGALTGATWYRDEYHVVVLREWGEQDAGSWPLSWHAPICDEDGLVGGSAGIKFKG